MRYLRFSIVLSLSLLAGCAGTECRAPAVNPSVTPTLVSATGAHVGDLAQWGGTLVEVRHLKDTTELEVVAHPLESCGRPGVESGQIGRFIIVYPGFLESTDYRSGRQVSATGRITAIRDGRLGDADYSFPLLESYKVHLWPDRRASNPYSRPWVNIGIGGGSGSVLRGCRSDILNAGHEIQADSRPTSGSQGAAPADRRRRYRA